MAAPNEYYVRPSSGNDTTGDGLSHATAWQTVKKAFATITRDTTDGDRINVNDEADDVISSIIDISTYGSPTAAAPLFIQGYTSTAGDGGIGGISGGGSSAIFTSTTQDALVIRDMHLHNTGANTVVTCDDGWRFINCEIDNSTASGVISDAGTLAINCHFHNLGANGIRLEGGMVVGCYFANGTNDFTTALVTEDVTDRAFILQNIFSLDGTSDGMNLNLNDSCSIQNNSLFTSGSGNGIVGGDTGLGFYMTIIGNLIEGFANGIDFNSTSYNTVVYAGNAFYDCTADEANKGDIFVDTDNESLGATPFAKSGSDTFALRATYWAPVDTGNVLSPYLSLGGSKGAVQPSILSAAGSNVIVNITRIM